MYFRPALVLALALAGLAYGQAPHPMSLEEETGRQLFAKTCAGCHGDNAKGGRGSDLTTGSWKHGGTEEEIITNIRKGIPGTQMPAFPVTETEARAMTRFLRTLGPKSDEKPLTGDAARGKTLFFGAAGCAHCHMVGGRGGRLGPDLTSLRDQMRPGEIRTAILEPSKSQRPGFEGVSVTFRDGRQITGSRRNEDTFSVQLMDSKEKLHLLLKRDLAKVEPAAASMMPPSKLPAAGVEDLVAFLAKGDRTQDPGEWKPAADFNVSFDRLLNAAKEPANWMTYWGNLRGTHSSALSEINAANVKTLRGAWAYQFGGQTIETSPIVVDGLMFVTGPLNDATALDARTGRPVWKYKRRVPDDVHANCTVMTNRGFGVLGDRLYMGTLDTHLLALDAKTGNVIFDVAVDDYQKGFSITHAPLAIDGKIIVGVTAGECGNNGFIDAYDAATGKKLWRRWAIAQPDDPAFKTWSGKSAETGGGPTWMTGTYDSETNTLFWTTGNPAPDYDGTVRLGDNLYTCSVLALDPATGRMKWHFQFTPHDVHDWDANETAMLVDAVFQGKPRKLLVQANRNAFFYVLDRTTGEFLLGKPFARQTWAKGLDAKGRPVVIPGTDPTPEGNYVCPDAAGSANWAAPSFSYATGLYYVAVREACASYTSKSKTPIPGLPYTGSGQQEDPRIGQPGAIRAIDPATGNIRWNFPLHIGNVAAGVLSTSGGLVFAASADGYLMALDEKTGKELWHYQTGALIRNSPISYSVGGKQYVAISGDTTLFTFALPDRD